MKKLLALVVICVMLMATLSACDSSQPLDPIEILNSIKDKAQDTVSGIKDQIIPTPPHEHSFVEGKCECGEEDPNYVPPHEHSFVEGKCECGEVDPNYVPPCNHSWVAPTCVADGYCYRCKAVGDKATGHDFKAATCADPATCKVCGSKGEDAKGHNYIEGICSECGACDHLYEQNTWYHPELIAATCCTPGVAVYECVYCDDYYTEEAPVDPEAHGFWGEEEILTEANCATQTNGIKKVACTNGCGQYTEVEIYYSEVHNWDVQIDTPATCTENGAYYAVCTLCGELDSYENEAFGHYNWYLTCGDSGECLECGEAFTLEHSGSEPTCTEAGFCYNCWSDYGEALGHLDEDGDCYCDRCEEDIIPETHERVDYNINISDLAAGTRSEDEINGVFTIVSGSEVRNRTKTYEGIEFTKSVKIGNKTTMIKVAVPGTGKLSFIIQNGSSSGAAVQYITVTGPDGTVYDIEFAGTDEGSPLVMLTINVTEGEWTISRGKNGGTQDIYYLSLSCVVEKSEENGFELVADGKTDYLVGEALDLSGVRLNATFSNGKTEPLSLEDVTVDTSLVDLAVSGAYTVTVSYKDYDPITYTVNVYLPESIKLDYDYTEKLSSNSQAGNGVYFNHSFKEVYIVGEELKLEGLTVTVVGKLGEEALEFIVPEYEVSGFDSSAAGKVTLTVSAFGVNAETAVYVVAGEAAPDEDGAYKMLVAPDYTGAIGALEGSYYVFTTIQQALDFAASLDAGAQKVIEISAGLYTEKLEITVPNLTIRGLGNSPEDVVIEWNSIYGQLDASGFSQVTDSTQTVAIRDNAYNVTIDNVTISNYWNSQERLDEAGVELERGLALLVQADRFVMTNSRLLGLQDTLELFTGRQYFKNVYISGYTDFIFGTNNTTLFDNCTIHMVDTTKDNKGTAGYLTAFKGSNKGSSDSIVYGAIFYGCKFTGDEGLTPGVHAIGRTWGAYAAVAIINSELGGHISTAAYNPSNNKNTRYISMNGIHPTDDTVQFVEYGNTGAGAITEAVAGMKMLTAEEAALYTDIATIFGTSNGNVTYLDPWDPKSEEIVQDDRIYYYFNGVTGASGTSYTYTDNIQGAVAEWEGLTIDATAGKLTSRGSDSQFNAGAKIIFNVKAGTLVTVITYPGYGFYTINGVAHNANDTFSMYFAEDSEVVVEATATSYLYQLIINPNEEAPKAPTVNEIKVSGVNVNYNVGDEFSLEGAVVKVYYSDSSVVTVTDYTVDTSAVNNAAAGAYDVVFTYGEMSVTVTVNYEDPNAAPEITENITLDFSTPEGLETVQNNPKVTIDGNVRHNGGEIQITGTISFKVKAGTVVTVIPYANTSYASFTIGQAGEEDLTVLNEMYSIMFYEDCEVVYTGLSNNYLVSIVIECPLADGKYVFGGSAEEGDVTGILESIPGLSITGTCKTHSGGAQLGADSQMTFTVPALTTVTIKGYDTNYGLLRVLVNGEPVEMNANAQYVFTTTSASTVVIEAVNVGTEEAPAWNKSYITYIDVVYPKYIEENVEITFGTEGNYKDSGIDFSGVQIGGGNSDNSQIKNGSFSFAIKAGATVVINGYPGYTSYTFGDGTTTSEEITAEIYTYTAIADAIITITPVSGNNYFYSFSVTYPAGEDEETEWVFDATADLEAMEAGAKADGETQAAGTDGFFTIHYSAKTKVDGSKKTFEDGYSATQRLNMGGSSSAKGTIKNVIEFTTDGAATVTIWWVSGGNEREIDLFAADGTVIETTAVGSTKNALYISTIEITEAGTYYIGSSAGSNYYFKVSVVG